MKADAPLVDRLIQRIEAGRRLGVPDDEILRAVLEMIQTAVSSSGSGSLTFDQETGVRFPAPLPTPEAQTPAPVHDVDRCPACGARRRGVAHAREVLGQTPAPVSPRQDEEQENHSSRVDGSTCVPPTGSTAETATGDVR